MKKIEKIYVGIFLLIFIQLMVIVSSGEGGYGPLVWSVSLFLLLLSPILSICITHYYLKLKVSSTLYIGISLSLPIIWLLQSMLFGNRSVLGAYLQLLVLGSSPVYGILGLKLAFKAKKRNESVFILLIATSIAWATVIIPIGNSAGWFS